MIEAGQIRAARALLDLSQAELAEIGFCECRDCEAAGSCSSGKRRRREHLENRSRPGAAWYRVYFRGRGAGARRSVKEEGESSAKALSRFPLSSGVGWRGITSMITSSTSLSARFSWSKSNICSVLVKAFISVVSWRASLPRASPRAASLTRARPRWTEAFQSDTSSSAIGCGQTRGPFFQNEPNFRSSVGWPQADPRFGATNASGSATRTFPPISSSNTLTRPLSSNRSSCPTTSAKGPAVTRMASHSFRSKWKRMPPSGSDALMRLYTTPGGSAAALLARSLVGKACAPFALTCLAKGERLYQVKPALAEGAES